jgi:hypothetical protein
MPKVIQAILGNIYSDVGIDLSPDHPDRDIYCLQLRQARRIAGELLEEVCRQLDESIRRSGVTRAGARAIELAMLEKCFAALRQTRKVAHHVNH